jgi:hypothetical protein
MGLPAYIINFDEIKQPIIDAINEANIEISTEGLELDSATISIDTSEIENILEQLKVKLSTISDTNIIIKETTQQILSSINHQGQTTDTKLNEISLKIQEIIGQTIDIHKILEDIKEQLASEGRPEITGTSMAIPAISGVYYKTFSFPEDILLTGITISQSAWNNNDYWDLKVGNFTLFNKIYSKMRGEHKQLSKFFPVKANTPIVFQYNNRELGNSKYVWFDLEFIRLSSETVNSSPLTETSPQVHISDLLIGGKYIDREVSELFVPDSYSHVLGEGEYDFSVNTPKAISSLDGIAIGSNMRLEVWLNNNDPNASKIFEGVGPMIINNSNLRNNYNDIINDSISQSAYNNIFNTHNIKWEDLTNWRYGKFRITKA